MTLEGSDLPQLQTPTHPSPPTPDDTTRAGGQQKPPGVGTVRDTLAPKVLGGKAVDTTAARNAKLRELFSDTTYVVYHDSTARMKEFVYKRHDSPYVEFFPDRPYPLFATYHGSALRRDVTPDSTGETVNFRETIGGEDVRVRRSLPLRDYLAARRAFELHKMIADEAHKSKAVLGKKDISELLTNFTQIQIPVPPNPILSIFGKNTISLNISGAVDIKAGFRNTKSDQTTLSVLDQSQNTPDFSQEVQVNVNGMIGDKLNILADWNTQRTFEYENQLKIKYTGYDDEIVQSVEAGNVSLQTPSSFIGSSQALFGVKAKFQTGPLTLTTLASQKKGQVKEVAVSGGAQSLPFEIRSYNYATNHFFVDTLYKRFYEPFYQNEPPVTNLGTKIVDEEVWVQKLGTTNDGTERQGIAYISLGSRGSGYNDSLRYATEVPGQVEVGRFVRLDRSQYELDGDGYLGEISLNTNVQDQQIIAIAYRTADGPQYGEFASRDLGVDSASLSKPVILKMVKPRNLYSTGRSYSVAWDQMLKNIYPIGGRNIKKNGFELDIFRVVPGSQDQNSILNQRLLRVFGLDKYNTDDTPQKDGDNVFDFRPGRTVNQARAEIIFPTLRPFDDGITKFFRDDLRLAPPDSTYYFPEIYDTTRTFAQQSQHDRYVIRGKATGDATSKYSLGFNVVEGSVQVLLDGQPLRPNLDYTVDYIVGEVVIRNDRALIPGANLQIKYEQNDLFQLASKTLLGARGDLSLSQNTNLGFTIMNLNQQTLSDKVRLGEEPSNNSILGFDGSTTMNLPFLTSALDALPLLQTHEPSQLKLSGEAAYMMPDPNTQKSTIASDGGSGVAYIDDFEGARRTIPVGISYTQWTQASPPSDSASFPLDTQDTTKMFSKGKMIWFNRQPTDVKLTDIYKNKQVGNNPANNLATVLDFRYFPNVRGMYNYSKNLSHTLTPQKNWAGVMKTLSVAATNLVNENIDYIEVWMRVDRAPPGSKMLVDMGAISEDAIPNKKLDTEDLVPPSSTINGTLQEWEDVGLDMINDAQERVQYADLVAAYPDIAGDPSGDDWAYDPRTVGTPAEDFTHINGTEGNRGSIAGLIPDTEDLNANGIVDLANSYFEYEIPLDTLGGVGGLNPRIAGGGNLGWYQFRIPIREYARTVGTPNFENVEFFRVLFVNALDTIAVRIADFSLVGNQWQEVQKGDSSFAVSVVSVEDNLDYSMPPGVQQAQDKTHPEDNIKANEQSLVLLLNGVPYGESRQAVKYYTYKPLDLFSYRTMKMFVHSDTSFGYRSESNYDVEVFYRFGLDSLNYYEYRAPLRQDPVNGNWSEITINFSDLTAIKQGRDSSNIPTPPKPVRDGPPGAVYVVLGNPSLTQVRYLAVGTTNRKPNRQPLYGQVWFDELRLISVDDSKGWAYRFDTSLKLADIGSVAFNFSKVDPNFHTLEERFGSRQTGTNWTLSANMQLDRFFPTDWAGTSIPLSYTRTVSKIQPKYLPNSDVVVTEASDEERTRVLARGGSAADASAAATDIILQSESYRVSDTYAVPSFKINLPSQAWYVRDTFNKLLFGFNYTRTTERNPATVRSLSWGWNVKMSYSVNLPSDYYLMPFKDLFDGLWFLDDYKNFKIFFPPTSFNWSLGANRSRSVSLQRTLGALETTTRNFSASRSLGFAWKLTEGGLLNPSGDYSLDIESSLLDFETDQFNSQRSFSKILSDIFFRDKVINFGKDTRYAQRNQFNTKPAIPNIFGLKKYFDLTFTYGVDYSWQNTLTSGDLGKSAGWNNTINLSSNLKLKQLFDPLFEDQPGGGAETPQMRGRRRGGEVETPQQKDTSQAVDTSSHAGPSGFSKTLGNLKSLLKMFIKVPFLDYDNMNVTFTQSNSAQNSGVVGRTGFVNFWGKLPFIQESDPQNGPSRLYQLGLISDPSGRLTNFGPRSHFPYFGWDLEPGIRAPGGVLINTFRQTNRLTFRTSRALWEGARIDLNWNIGWSYNKTDNLIADSITGMPSVQSTGTTGSIERSFLSFPDVLFLGVFKSSLKDVSKRYADLKQDPTMTDEARLTKAFEEGFEALPIFSKAFGQYYPRVNWSLRWDGLERLPLFAGFVSRLSLDHTYNSTYTRQFRNQPGTTPGTGGETTDGQRVSYGFAPLVGLNFSFKELFKGSFGANLRYNTTTSYDFAPSSRNIVETFSREISVTASFNRKGFEIPLFGLALNNDVDLSMSYSVTANSSKTYDVSKLDVSIEGVPLEGSTRTVMEPRIKYVLSLRVTAAIYYRYTKIAPDSFGSRIPGSTTNEAGLDLHIAIQ